MKKIKPIYLILLTFSFFIILHSFLKFHFILWDEAVYIGIGKYIYSLGKFGLWEDIRPLGLPLLISFLWVLGLKEIVFIDLLIILPFSLGTIYLVYLMGKKLFNENIALLSSLLLAITPVFFYNTFKILTEIPSSFFALLAIYFFLKKKFSLSGIFSGISFMFKFPQGLLLFIFLIILFFEEKKFLKIRNLLIFFLIPVIPFLIFNQIVYGNFLYTFIRALKHQSSPIYIVKNPLLNLFYYPIYLFSENLILIFFLFSLIKWKKIKIHIPLIFLSFLLYFTLIQNKQLRFSLLFLPYLALLSSYGFFWFFERIRKSRTLIFFFLIFTFLSFSLSIYFDFHQFHRFPVKEPEIVSEYYKFFPKNSVILSSDPVFVAYSDIKLLPYYNSIYTAEELYESYKDQAQFIAYNGNSFPCTNPECERLKEEFFNKIKKENELIFSKKYEETKYIFKIK